MIQDTNYLPKALDAKNKIERNEAIKLRLMKGFKMVLEILSGSDDESAKLRNDFLDIVESWWDDGRDAEAHLSSRENRVEVFLTKKSRLN